MTKLTNNIIKIADKHDALTLSKDLLLQLKRLYSSRASNSSIFANSIKNDLIAEMQKFRIKDTKALQEEAKKQEKEILRSAQELDKSLLELKNTKKEYEQSATVLAVYNLLASCPEDSKLKQYYKVNDMEKQIKHQEEKVNFALKDNHYQIDQAGTKLTEVLDKFQNIQLEKLQAIKDTLLKQIIKIFEVSLAKTVQYDVDQITEVKLKLTNSKKVNQFEPEEYIQVFLSHHIQQNQFYPKESITHYNSFILHSLQKKLFKKEFNLLSELQSNKTVQKIIQETLNGDERHQESDDCLCEKAYLVGNFVLNMFDEKILILDEQIGQLKMRCSDDEESRKMFILCMQQQRDRQMFLLGEASYSKVVKAFEALLDICLENFDASTAKSLMNLSFTFYSKVADETIYLHNGLVKHSIWKLRDFWQTVLIEQIYEELTKVNQKNDDLLQRQKAAIFSILTQVSQNMLLFEFQFDLILDILRKFCNFFSLNSDVSAELITALENFQKNNNK